MIHTNTSERYLENFITKHLVEINGYEQGVSSDYNPLFGLDEKRLLAFLLSTQAGKVASSGILVTPIAKRKFLERVRSEITKRGVVDVLRKGVKHLSHETFELYMPLPSALSDTAQADYGKNRFVVTRQVHYSNSHADLSVDLMISINGLPVITMELKNNLSCQSTEEAVRQYKNDRDPKELLFMPKRCAVHFAVDNDTVMMCAKLVGADSTFLPFNKGLNEGAGNPINPYGMKTAYLWEDILRKERLSDIIEHYAQVAKEKDEETGKIKEKIIWPRWHQLEAVRLLLAATEQNPIGRRFLVQHSAGSGKSNSITWLAYQLEDMKRDGKDFFDSVIVVTDRVNLDKQLHNNVRSFTHNTGVIKKAASASELATLLKAGQKIIFTTVQKFKFILEAVAGQLGEKQFAVIIDEAHSSQSGKQNVYSNQALAGGIDEIDSEDEVNEHIEQYMQRRRMAPNANFYAFTATPKPKTSQTFGEPHLKDNGETEYLPFHHYSMRQAIEEGFILDVLKGYTTYRAAYRINKAVEGEPKFDRDQANRKLRYFVESQPETIEKKAAIMVEHFHINVAHKIGGEARAMVVTEGIERAIDYFYTISRLLNERNSPYKTIVAFSGNIKYHGDETNEAKINGFPSSRIEKIFASGDYRFLIVADKFQTGYDEPLLHTMYVDKSLHGVKTVQTLSRLNRICPPLKTDTSVLDFANSSQDIEADFQTFYQTTILSRETDPNKLNDLIDTIEEYEIYSEEELDELNKRYWSKMPMETILPILDTIVERFKDLESDEGKVKLKSSIKSFVRTYEFLSTILQQCSIEWEKRETLYTLLLRKLPKLAQIDLAEGLLESVDFERVRIKKIEERDIQLKNVNGELSPVSTGGGGVFKEPDMMRLSDIVKMFNEQFGIIIKDEKVVLQQFDELVKRVKQEDTVRNSTLNSDEDTANQDIDSSVEQHLSIITSNST